jgi:hypothetical protein
MELDGTKKIIDAAPASGLGCGEWRIVTWMTSIASTLRRWYKPRITVN